MDIVALMLAFTWEEIVALLIAAGLGYLIGWLHQKFLGAQAGGPELSEWPNEDCAETGGPAIQALMEILSLAQNAPPNERSTINDLVGLFEGFKPKFVRRYAELGAQLSEAARAYVRDVKNGTFPSAEESY